MYSKNGFFEKFFNEIIVADGISVRTHARREVYISVPILILVVEDMAEVLMGRGRGKLY